MNKIILLSALCIGASGITAQTVLLRELLVAVLGNELTLGLILANWVIAEAAGALVAGRWTGHCRRKTDAFALLLWLNSAALFCSLYLGRTFRAICGIPAGTGLGLHTIAFMSLATVLPAAFTHGALFTNACRLYVPKNGVSAKGIGLVYCAEALGTLLAGVLLTIWLIQRLSAFELAGLAATANLFAGLLLFKSKPGLLPRYMIIVSAFLLFICVPSGSLKRIEESSVRKQWPQIDISSVVNSPYGNILVGNRAGETTFFYNGSPVITTPHPDSAFTQDFGNLALLFHPAPRQVLAVCSGAGGVLSEILKHPIARLEYVELDPYLIRLLERYGGSLVSEELHDPRVRITQTDARSFMKQEGRLYDIVLIGAAAPADLSGNRLFTSEFFSMVKSRLKVGGIASFYLPGSTTYLSSELRDLNAGIIRAASTEFPYLRALPGDQNILLASDSSYILHIGVDTLSERIKERGIDSPLLTERHLEYRLETGLASDFWKAVNASRAVPNLDSRPFAVFANLIYWQKKFAPSLVGPLQRLARIRPGYFFAGYALLVFLMACLFRKKRLESSAAGICIATSGFFGMLMSLLLIFSFQLNFGNLYQAIGLLVGLFMAGAAAGSAYATRQLDRLHNPAGAIIAVESLSCIYCYVVSVFVLADFTSGLASGLGFAIIFFGAGFILGLEFPLASRILLDKGRGAGATSGLLYGLDLAGACLAGLTAGVILLPLFGFSGSLLLTACLKLGSLAFMLAAFKRG